MLPKDINKYFWYRALKITSVFKIKVHDKKCFNIKRKIDKKVVLACKQRCGCHSSPSIHQMFSLSLVEKQDNG